MIKYILTFVFVLLSVVSTHSIRSHHHHKVGRKQNHQQLNERPVVAILTCEFDIMNTGIPVESMPLTYTNYLEHAGARAVPVSFKASKEDIYKVLDKVNGVLFTGGDIMQFNKTTKEFHQYYRATEMILDYVIQKNIQGDYFPLFAICQGFQSLHLAISNNPYIMSDSFRWGHNDTFKPMIAYENSRFLSNQQEDLYDIYSGSEVEFNWHQFGITLDTYQRSPNLSFFFKVISFDTVPGSEPIVATVEAYDYPIYATQYHPEKNKFDFLHSSIPHGKRAQQFAEDLIFFFVEECRKNSHQFDSYAEEVALHMSNHRRYFGFMEHGGDNVFIDYYVF